MKKSLASFKSPALISFIMVLPFMILELINRQKFNVNFPSPLFIILWLLPMIFIVTLMPIVQNLRAGGNLTVNPIALFFRVVLLLFLAWLWVNIIVDQMPCFLGIPNCD